MTAAQDLAELRSTRDALKAIIEANDLWKLPKVPSDASVRFFAAIDAARPVLAGVVVPDPMLAVLDRIAAALERLSEPQRIPWFMPTSSADFALPGNWHGYIERCDVCNKAPGLADEVTRNAHGDLVHVACQAPAPGAAT